MATSFSNSLQMSNSTTTLLRAWAGFIDSMLTTGGWVNTTDTGQTAIASLAVPTGTNQVVGFRIYRMNDTLQATTPCFLKIGYGSGAAINTPNLQIQIGLGTDGAGNITNSLFSSFGSASFTPTTNATSSCDSFGSADVNRCSFLMFVRGGANDVFTWSLERTKDSSGNDTAAGFLLTGQDSAGSSFTWYINGTFGPQPTGERHNFILSMTAPAFGSNVGVGLPSFFYGTVQQYGLGMIFMNSSDTSAESPISLSIYGATHTYQLGNSGTNQVFISTGPGGITARAATRVGIRYE